MQQRMGIVIFGPSGSGKTSVTKLLNNVSKNFILETILNIISVTISNHHLDVI